MSATPPATGTPPPTREANNRGGRGNNNRNRAAPRRAGSNVNTFKGTIKEMNGHVFQCHGESNEKNQFARTIEELSNYVGLNFKHHPDDIKKMIQNMVDTTLSPPTDPTTNATQTQTLIWTKEVDLYVKRKETYSSNKCALYSVVWGQCSPTMQARVKTEPTYSTTHENNDSLELMNSIKGISYKFESQKNIYLSLDNAKAAYYTYRQGREETDSEFAANFGNIVKVIEHYGGQVHEDKATLLAELKTSTGDATITIDTATGSATDCRRRRHKKKEMPWNGHVTTR